MLKSGGDRFIVFDAKGIKYGPLPLESILNVIRSTPGMFDGDNSVRIESLFHNFVYDISQEDTQKDIINAWKSYMGFI